MDNGVQSFVSARYVPRVVERMTLLGGAGRAPGLRALAFRPIRQPRLADARRPDSFRHPTMYEYGQTEDQQPVMYVRGYPVYAAYLLVAAFVASMLATTVLMGVNVASVWDKLPFTSAGVLRGQVWRVLSYGLLNPPSLDFAIDMVILAWFGREGSEKFLGGAKFGFLFAGIYLLPPLLLTLVGIWFPATFFGEHCVLAVFIAFAAIYPDVGIFFGVPSKWVAAILVGIYTLMDLANHSWVAGVTLWATCGFATFFFIRRPVAS